VCVCVRVYVYMWMRRCVPCMCVCAALRIYQCDIYGCVWCKCYVCVCTRVGGRCCSLLCVCVCVYVCPRGHNQCIAYVPWKLSPCFHSLIPKCKHRILYAITSVLTPFDCHGRVSSALHPNPPHTRMCVCVRVLSMWVCAGDYEAVSMCMCMCIYYVWTCPSH